MIRLTRRKRRGESQPTSSASILGTTFSRLKLQETARSYAAMRAFALAAGPRLIARARAERLQRGVLWIRAATSAWTQELQLWKPQLLEKLSRIEGGDRITDLRFTVGPLDELPDWEDVLAPPAPQQQPQIPVEKPVEVLRAIADIEDPELRDVLAQLALLQAQRPR